MEYSQNTDTVLMISPVEFGFNNETSLTNSFQSKPSSAETKNLNAQAKFEFDQFVDELKKLDVNVIVFEDKSDSLTPDSIFPNNWFSTHQTGELVVYPMAVDNRRAERRRDIISALMNDHKYEEVNLTHFENSKLYLEGTGSLIIDHINKVAYTALSPRSDKTVLTNFAKSLELEPISFHAYGKQGELIYHTNVMMSICDNYVLIGDQTIAESQRNDVISTIKKSGKQIIRLTNKQIYEDFAGNMLQIKNRQGESILVMSEKAFVSLTDDQRNKLDRLNDHILPIQIPTIERIGGGSVRCMLAEIFKPKL